MTDSPNIRRMRRHDRLGYLLDRLERMRQYGPERFHIGICCNLPVNLRGEVLAYAKTWPRYTGNRDYPVPHPHIDAETAYKARPLWQGEYGDNRRELLAFLIGAVRKDLGTASSFLAFSANASAAFKAIAKAIADAQGQGHRRCPSSCRCPWYSRFGAAVLRVL